MFACLSDRECVLDPESRFQDRHQPDRPRDAIVGLDVSNASACFDHLLRVLDLGNQDQVGRLRDDFVEIFEAEWKLVDAHHAFAAQKINRTQRIANQQAGSIFLARVD